ncbi:hypothetical protein Pan97_27270 [Bremerella volcania]|uniref:Uncharacterized protein n=1 Tax=Bremerella volcania TaxID=2527984 RepID=A0A518C901_9BACT|nr:hypothetical protein [Bremerella volcania]QDU75692.1 hypothetical protein Pan97_27270 [Bremerella volcania]
MTKKFYLTAALLLLGLVAAPMPVEAGWNAWLRYCGEFWSDGYHSKGDPWNRPTKHARELSSYQPYYPAYETPMPAMEEQVPTPAKQNVATVSASSPVIILPKSN